MNSQLGVIGRLFFQSIFLLAFLLACPKTQAAELQYQVEINVTAENANGQMTAIKSLLEKHLPLSLIHIDVYKRQIQNND